MDNVAIKVSDVDKYFKLPHEKQSSIKGVLLNLFKGGRTFERQQALKNINLEINKGEFFGIVGKNGGGKSTILKILSGIYTPDTGAVIVNGKLTAFIELGVGFNPELTGRENVNLSGALLGFSQKEVDAMYDDIVSFAEIERFMDQKLKNYSSGMQVRLAFSIAIRAKSDILILDEVLAVGDAAFQQKCYNYFEGLKQDEQTVVFVSHDMGAIRRFCSRAAYIRDGKILKVGTPNDISDLYLEDNIHVDAPENEAAAAQPTDSKYKLHLKSLKQSDGKITVKFSYKSPADEKMIIGISIVKDGASIAEVCTPRSLDISGEGVVSYSFNTDIFNAGIFNIAGISFFTSANKELKAVAGQTKEFVIKGADETRAGAVKLPESWSRVED